MKIGVFGGSFDPVHKGHIELLQAFSKAIVPDKLLVIPAFVSPFKQKSGAALPHQRLEMCRLAFAELPDTEVCDLEIRREGPSYTYETLQTLSQLYPHSQLYFLTGADSFLTIQNWKRPDIILQLATVCAAPRNMADMAALQQHAAFLQRSGGRTELLNVRIMTVSSTDIRRRVRDGESITELVPPAVEAYIHRNRLYLTGQVSGSAE